MTMQTADEYDELLRQYVQHLHKLDLDTLDNITVNLYPDMFKFLKLIQQETNY